MMDVTNIHPTSIHTDVWLRDGGSVCLSYLYIIIGGEAVRRKGQDITSLYIDGNPDRFLYRRKSSNLSCTYTY